ncbi:MAG: SixA phosphatase family protein [Angustibacter sp.]
MDASRAGRTLLLVRHAKSDQHVGGRDHDRPLNARGRRDATALGRWVAGHTPSVDLVLCSSAQRAQETWELAARELAQRPPLDVRPSLYLAQPQALLQQLRTLPDDVGVVVVVGHEPTQSTLVELLAGESDPVAAQEFSEGFRTGAVATVAASGQWTGLGPGSCRLAGFTVPRG